MRQIKPSAQFREEKPHGAAIEVTKGVDGQETTLGKGQELQRQVPHFRRRSFPSSLEITTIVTHQHGQSVGECWLQATYLDLDVTPLSGPVRHQISTDAAVQFHDQPFIQRLSSKLARQDCRLHLRDAVRQQWSQLRVAQDTLRGFNKAGGSIRASVARRRLTGTGSRSKAMLCATSIGIASQLRRSFSSGGRLRQWVMFSFQFMRHRLGDG